MKNQPHKYCHHCGALDALTVDHIKPRSRGGDNSINNTRPLCVKCNAAKGRHTDLELSIILCDIHQDGVRYRWEKPFEEYLLWLRKKCHENNYSSPLINKLSTHDTRE